VIHITKQSFAVGFMMAWILFGSDKLVEVCDD
jgi:hypothetical protein